MQGLEWVYNINHVPQKSAEYDEKKAANYNSCTQHITLEGKVSAAPPFHCTVLMGKCQLCHLIIYPAII